MSTLSWCRHIGCDADDDDDDDFDGEDLELAESDELFADFPHIVVLLFDDSSSDFLLRKNLAILKLGDGLGNGF